MAVAITEEPNVGLSSLQPLWHEKAPPQLVQSGPDADPIAEWPAWQQYLRKRRKPAAPPLGNEKQSALLWGWPATWQRDAIQTSLASPSTLAELAIGDDATNAPDLALSLQLVALAYAMPRLAEELPAETWWFLVERLHTTATQARTQRIDWSAAPEDVVRNQLLAGELPLVLGYLFPEIRALHTLRDEARVVFSEALVELTDGQGLPHGRLLPVFGPLFACWTRARSVGKRLRRGAWSRAAERQFEWLVRNAIRLADADGSFLLASKSTGGASGTREGASLDGGGWNGELFETALKLAGDRGDHAAAIAALPAGIVAKPKRLKRKDLPQPSLNSDWSGITVMASGWSQSAARIAVAYSDHPPTLELSVDGQCLFSGSFAFTTTCDGAAVEPVGEWEQLCWESNKKYDFLELGLQLTSNLKLERQLLFGRQDRILYVADIILSSDDSPRHLRHSLEMPLADGAQWQPEIETRDGALTINKVRAAVMPLGLTEWRTDPRSGSLIERDGRLVLVQEARGRALCCPLMIDLKTKRSATERTWRQLTVAEWMEIIPSDVAVGYRAQSGDDQWLLYRSLGPAGNRTLLGHNIAGEFCAGRFVDGKFKEWIEIEAV